VVAAAMALGASASASVVYDNTTTYLGKEHSITGGGEFGDQITLAGSDRSLSSFSLAYHVTPGTTPTAEVFIRANDGPIVNGNAASPGTVLYQSGSFTLAPDANGFGTVNGTGITGITLQDSVTWSVNFGATGGLLVDNPPSIGSSFNDFWVKSGTTWSLDTLDGGATPANFNFKLSAVPEPSTWAMLLGGLSWIGFLGFRTLRPRCSAVRGGDGRWRLHPTVERRATAQVARRLGTIRRLTANSRIQVVAAVVMRASARPRQTRPA
jgi:hypothetical protein